MRRLAQRLGIDGSFVLPGYEDAWYYLWRERKLPSNVDPFESRLDDELERARLRRVFDRGLASPAGYALPIRREASGVDGAPRWGSSRWFLRDERMYLVPGDSPMGYRLPLDSLPWAAPDERPLVVEHDPFAPREPLPLHADIRAHYAPHASAVASPKAERSHCRQDSRPVMEEGAPQQAGRAAPGSGTFAAAGNQSRGTVAGEPAALPARAQRPRVRLRRRPSQRRDPSQPHRSRAPRCASKCAIHAGPAARSQSVTGTQAACCTCSCLRCRRSRITSSCWRPSKRRRRN